MVTPVVVERAHPQPLRPKQLGVNVGDTAAHSFGETFGLREQCAILPDHRLTVPGQVRR
ncbi:Uncharacterised protein [Mycobacterium tuberculosis]|nr:Uncharacterised protein [Mycobacterium tuberculosis]